MNLSCIIIDDEPNAVNLLVLLVQQTTPWHVLAKCYNGLEALAFLKEQPVDLVFLDINMPQLNGMELACLLPTGTKIVFTTAHSEHAVDSYNYQTIDYLLKPITLKRFLLAVQKIETYFDRADTYQKQDMVKLSDEYFFVKSGKMLSKILLGDILYFEGEKEYVKLVTAHEQLLIYRRLKDVEERLALPFIRVHNSYVINLKQIDKIQDNHLFINGERIPISDKFRENLMLVVNNRLF